MSTQTDPNAAHNAKVQEIADELISILYPESITDSYGLPYSKEKLKKQADRKLQICLPAARAMTAKMKEEFSEGYYAAMHDQGLSRYESDPDLKQHLIKRGLIPAKPEDNA